MVYYKLINENFKIKIKIFSKICRFLRNFHQRNDFSTKILLLNLRLNLFRRFLCRRCAYRPCGAFSSHLCPPKCSGHSQMKMFASAACGILIVMLPHRPPFRQKLAAQAAPHGATPTKLCVGCAATGSGRGGGARGRGGGSRRPNMKLEQESKIKKRILRLRF